MPIDNLGIDGSVFLALLLITKEGDVLAIYGAGALIIRYSHANFRPYRTL